MILLRESDGTEKNPFSFEARSQFVEEALSKEGFRLESDFVIVRVPNITHITYGRDVGYSIEQEVLDAEIEAISATAIREKMNDH